MLGVATGDVLRGRYKLQDHLEGGGLGRMFRAWDLQDRRAVAVKVYDPARCPPAALSRFASLLALAARVRHPGAAVPHASFADPTLPFTVGAALDGEDLGALRAREGALPWTRAVDGITRCAETLAALSAATQVAHRALKPSNLWITASGEIQVLDFGVAELGVQPVKMRGDGQFVEYRAPEQLEGAGGDLRTDVFSLGVLLFELCTGVHPFTAGSAYKVTHRVLLHPAPRPGDVAPAIALPTQVEALLARMLARRPEDRFADAADLLRTLVLIRRSAGPLSPRSRSSATATPAVTTAAAVADVPAPVEDPTTELRLPLLRELFAARASSNASAPASVGPSDARGAAAGAEQTAARSERPVEVERPPAQDEVPPTRESHVSARPQRPAAMQGAPQRPIAAPARGASDDAAPVDRTEVLPQLRPAPERTLASTGDQPRARREEERTRQLRREVEHPDSTLELACVGPERRRAGEAQHEDAASASREEDDLETIALFRGPAVLVASPAPVASPRQTQRAAEAASAPALVRGAGWTMQQKLVLLNVICGVLIVAGWIALAIL